MKPNSTDGIRFSNGANKNNVYDNVMDNNVFYAVYSCEGFLWEGGFLLPLENNFLVLGGQTSWNWHEDTVCSSEDMVCSSEDMVCSSEDMVCSIEDMVCSIEDMVCSSEHKQFLCKPKLAGSVWGCIVCTHDSTLVDEGRKL